MPSVQELLNDAGIHLKSYLSGRYLCTCPQCSNKRKAHNQKRAVLGVRIDGERAWWGCNHCGWTGPQAGAGNGHYQRDDRVRYEYGANIKIRTGKSPPFVWMHLTNDGRLEKGTKDLDPCALYRLEDVTNKRVAIVEGEKDVETMWRLGIPAVCNAHGAGKWTPGHSARLKGFSIYVFNDNDEPGYAHAKTIVECSRNVVDKIFRIDLKDFWPGEMPAGADITDFIEQGCGDAAFVKQLIDEAPVMNGHDPGAQKTSLPTFGFAELEQMHFDPLKFVVNRYFPVGFTLLAGKPKVGKSWLMLSIALAVADGGIVLGEDCPQRDVLYFALEDSKQRLYDRTKLIRGGTTGWPANLYGALELPGVDQGGLDMLQRYIDHYKTLGLVIIDTLGQFRGRKRKDEEQYSADLRCMTELHKFGLHNNLSVIAVHHVRKATADDPMDKISGTLGLNAGADTLAVLDRIGDRLRLVTRGRDVEEQDVTVERDPDTAEWTVTGEYEEQRQSKREGANVGKILDLLRDAKYAMSPDQIAKHLGLNQNTVRSILTRLYDTGQIKRESWGAYRM